MIYMGTEQTMRDRLYQIEGYEGAWKMISSYVNDQEDLFAIFQEVEIGCFIEIKICPFEALINLKHDGI